MNILLKTMMDHGALLDVMGVLGLGLVALAAIRLATRHGSVGGTIMTWGALALLVGRIGVLLFSHLSTQVFVATDPVLMALGRNVPGVLLTLGIGVIVWGLWTHERGAGRACPLP